MTKLNWDKIGERFYEAGVDHGVLYLPSGKGVAWNGITSIDESTDATTTPLYYDGGKFYDQPAYDDYSATLKVLTYPDEFMPFDGVQSIGQGLYVEDQSPKRFSLSYRVQVGNDIQGLDYGYQIHLVYNLSAIGDSVAYSTEGKSLDPVDFGWSLSAIPEVIANHKATAHAIIDTRQINKYLLQDLYDILYGTATSDPRLPSLNELTALVDDWALIRIVDNGDGTWTATGPDEFFTIVNHQFTITSIDATYFGDGHTYTASTTTL